MPNYNRTILMGNLTRDPELKYLPNGTAVANFGIAVNRKFNDRNSGEEREEVLFIDVNFFGPRAEVVERYLSKGTPIHLEGRLRLEQWQADDGSNRSRHTIVGDSFEFVQTRAEAEANGGGSMSGPTGAPTNQQQSGELAEDGDVPF